MENKLLLDAKKSKELIEIYDDKDDVDEFFVARVLDVNDLFVLIEIYNNFGVWNGVYVIKLADINQVSIGTTYLNEMAKQIKKIESLMEVGLLEPNLRAKIKNLDLDKINLKNVLTDVLNGKIFCEIYLYNGAQIFGYVTAAEESMLIKLHDKFGSYDGEAIINKSDIKSLLFYSYKCYFRQILAKKEGDNLK